MSALLSVTAITDDPDRFVARHGTVTARFDRTQDSGNVSWLVESDGRRLFVKTPGADVPPPPGAPVPQATRPSRDDRPATVAAFAGA